MRCWVEKVDNAGRFVIRNANFMISQRGYLNLVGFQAESLPTVSRTDIYDLAGNELNAQEMQKVTQLFSTNILIDSTDLCGIYSLMHIRMIKVIQWNWKEIFLLSEKCTKAPTT